MCALGLGFVRSGGPPAGQSYDEVTQKTTFSGEVAAPSISTPGEVSAETVTATGSVTGNNTLVRIGDVLAAERPLLVPLRKYATKAAMDADAALGLFSDSQRMLLADPLFDAIGTGVLYEYCEILARCVRVLNNRPYSKLGCGVGSGITFVPTTSLVVVPFPTISPNGGTKKLARGIYRNLNAEGAHTTPGWHVMCKIDWANVSAANAKLNLLLKIGSVSFGTISADCADLTIDTVNGNSLIIWAEWDIHPNGPVNAGSYNFDVHHKIRYGAANKIAGQAQAVDIGKTNWHFAAVSDGSDASPVHPEITILCSYGNQAGVVYFDTLSVQENG